jgi:hypothetical protein
MTIVGMWLAIVGYGIAFAGMNKLGGGQCSILDAFRNRCGGGAKATSATTPQAGATLLAQQQAAQQQQAAMIGSTPIGQAI